MIEPAPAVIPDRMIVFSPRDFKCELPERPDLEDFLGIEKQAEAWILGHLERAGFRLDYDAKVSHYSGYIRPVWKRDLLGDGRIRICQWDL